MAVLVWPLAVVAFLALLWTVSSVARCLIKWTVFVVVSLISACVPIPLMLLRPRDSRNALIPSAGFRACSRILGISLKVEGKENVVKGSGTVVVINHQSFLDLIVLACVWPVMDNCTVISKKEIFYLQPFGLASWLWGTIFIDRVNAKDAQGRVNQTAEIIRKRKARVLMFPEGTRNLGNKKLLPFKKGAFHLAVSSGCPIQPVAVSRYRFLGPLRFDSGSIKIKILPSIDTKGLTKDDIPKLIDETYAALSESVDLLSADDAASATT
ncbi:1-acyl-sn-glycerol-3-phosphate acyltransferase alpha [Cylas formicarius]|uniref:1-acyl-sn-glycerol-3-phosphate acyltransferase alpha n=1 Tax=Cylas formicarius TaxID=197179 RepID=UPI002958A916|nr:1-acyl-sn-glycerol-3-phosphate acyltransferase alpha [Cylas formicarius]